MLNSGMLEGGRQGGVRRTPQILTPPLLLAPQIFGPTYNSPLQIFRPCNMPANLIKKIKIKKAYCHSRKTLKNPLFAQKTHRKRLLLTIPKKDKKKSR